MCSSAVVLLRKTQVPQDANQMIGVETSNIKKNARISYFKPSLAEHIYHMYDQDNRHASERVYNIQSRAPIIKVKECH